MGGSSLPGCRRASEEPADTRTFGYGRCFLKGWLPRRSHTVTALRVLERLWVQALDGERCEKCDRLGNHLFRRAA